MNYLEVKNNKDLQEVVRSIKAEKYLVTFHYPINHDAVLTKNI